MKISCESRAALQMFQVSKDVLGQNLQTRLCLDFSKSCFARQMNCSSDTQKSSLLGISIKINASVESIVALCHGVSYDLGLTWTPTDEHVVINIK